MYLRFVIIYYHLSLLVKMKCTDSYRMIQLWIKLAQNNLLLNDQEQIGAENQSRMLR